MAFNKIPLALKFNDTTGNAEGLQEFTLNLSDTGDVCSGTSPVQGNSLVYNGNEWCPSTIPTGGGGSLPVATNEGDILIAADAGSEYNASAPSDAGFVTVDHAQPRITFSEEGEILTYNGSELEASFPDSIFIRIKNNDDVSLNNGDPVYVTTSGGTANTLLVAKADASDPNKMPAVGVVAADAPIAVNGLGRIVSFGKADINASGMTPGDILYVAVGGGLHNAPPTGATELIQNIGVLSVAGTNGKMKVTGVGRSNAVPNTITVGTGDSKTTIHIDGTSLGNTEPNSVVITDSSTSGYASGLSGVSGELVYFEGSPARPGTQSINQVLTNAGISFVNPSRILAYNINSVTIAGEDSSYPRWSVTSTNAVDQANSDITIGTGQSSSGVTFNTAGDYQIDCAVTTSGTGAYTTNCLLVYDDGESGFTDISESVSYSYGSTSESTAHITSIISAGAGSLIAVKVTPNSSVNLLTDGTTLRILRLS